MPALRSGWVSVCFCLELSAQSSGMFQRQRGLLFSAEPGSRTGRSKEFRNRRRRQGCASRSELCRLPGRWRCTGKAGVRGPPCVLWSSIGRGQGHPGREACVPTLENRLRLSACCFLSPKPKTSQGPTCQSACLRVLGQFQRPATHGLRVSRSEMTARKRALWVRPWCLAFLRLGHFPFRTTDRRAPPSRPVPRSSLGSGPGPPPSPSRGLPPADLSCL